MPENSTSLIGTGISLQGQPSADYFPLAMRLNENARIRKEKRKKEEIDNLEFDTKAASGLQPHYFKLYMDNHRAMVMQYEKDKTTMGADKAAQKLVLDKMKPGGYLEQANKIVSSDTAYKGLKKQYEEGNTLVPRFSEITNAVNKDTTTPQEFAAIRDGGAFYGVTVGDDGLGLFVPVVPNKDVEKTLQERHKGEEINMEYAPFPMGGAKSYTETPVTRSTDMNIAAMDLAKDEILFKNWAIKKEQWIKENHPKALDITIPQEERLEEQSAAAMDYMPSVFPIKRGAPVSRGYDYPPGYGTQQTAAKKQPTLTHSVTEVFPTREQLAKNPVKQQHDKNIQAMRKLFDESSFEKQPQNEEAFKEAGLLDDKGKLITGTTEKENEAIENKKIEVIDELITKNHPNFFKENERSERLNVFTIEKTDDKQNTVFEFNSKGTVYRDASPSDIIIRNNKPYVRLFVQSTSTKEGVPPRSREIEIPYEGTTRARLSKEFNTDNLLRDELQKLNVDADKILNAWDGKNAQKAVVQKKYTEKQETLIEKNMKANPDYTREEIIKALGIK